jgi:uncharacterized protein (TIGR02246 family)
MSDDERAIRKLIDTWMTASRMGDLQTVLGLMSDDVVFLVPGKKPFGKAEFAATSGSMKDVRIEGRSEIRELEIAASWAWVRADLSIVMTSPGGEPIRRSGPTLTILRKQPDGRWLLARDANLLGAA